MGRERTHKLWCWHLQSRVQSHWQCQGYNVDIWESLEKGLNPISAGQAGHCLAWRQNQPRSHLFCQMFACLVLPWKFWVSLGCLLPWWTPTGDNFLRSNLCLAHYNQFKLVFWPVLCEQGELLIACLSTVSFHSLKTAVSPFSFLDTKHPEFPSSSDPLCQVFQMFDHHCCFPVLPVYAHGGLLSLRLLAQCFLSHLK